MELSLKDHPLFTEYRNPKSGAVSFILDKPPVEFVKHFYFVNRSLSRDNKILWLNGFLPPLYGKLSLCAVSLDPKDPFVKHFPGTDGTAHMLSEDGRSVFFVSGNGRHFGIYQQHIDGRLETFAELPDEIIANRFVFSLATHLTVSADGKYMLLDASIGNQWVIMLLEMKTKEFRVLKEFSMHYNHAQFSPVDPKTFAVDQDWYFDRVSGRYIEYDQRMWLMDVDGNRLEPVVPKKWYKHGSLFSHDFWSGDGYFCVVDFKEGAFEIDPVTLEKTHVWDGPLCHAHCSSNRKLWIADESPYKWHEDCKVLFFNRETGKETEVFSLPAPVVPRNGWHLDPHPQFSFDDRHIITTVTLNQKVTVAITPVDQFCN